MSTQSLTLPPPPPQPQASGENPLSTRDGEDDDAAPGDLRLNFSESIEALSLSTLQNTRSSTFKSTTSPGTNAKFNPHVTVGGTVHASSRLAVGRNGVSYGADTRFRLDPSDFAPLRVSADVLSSAPNSRENTTLTHEVSSSSSSSQPPAAAPTSESTSVSTGNLLGRGASGSVRLMVHLPTARPVAVKTIATVEKHHFDEILSEIRALCDAKTAFDSALNSPTPLDFDAKDESPLGVPPSPSAPGFIVDFLGAWSTDGFVNIAMECMAGSLADIDSPPVPILSRMSNMLLKGLSVMHRKLSLLHRDLKPANVLFDATGVVKVADFGVSSRLEASKLEQTSTFIGSIMYMSPERVKGESYSYSSDVWALAITIMEVFLGQHPFRAHAGDAAFHGNHEKKFWKMVEVFTTAAAFDRQLANVLEYAKKHGNGGEAIVPEQSPPLAQVAKVSDAQDYPSILEMANTAGFDLGDPRIPANAGYVARICTKDPRVPRELADFVTRCLSMSQFNRATVVELMSHPFIQMHCQSPEADRRAVSQWLLTYVPKVATSPALAQAARDVAAAKLCNATVAAASTISTGKADGESPKAAEKDAAARNPSPPAAVVKSAKVRAALSNLAAEPKPAPKAKAVVVAPAKASSTADGSIFADDPSGVGSSGCCLWTGMTPQQQKPAPTTKEASPTASPPQVPAAAPGKPNNTATTSPSDGNCMVS